jgi:hypothetical protein
MVDQVSVFMRYYSRFSICILLAITFLSACSKKPETACYIPKDAVAVAEINLKSLSKKIAWNLITGSKLFKEMQKRIPEKSTKDAMSGIEKAGIDAFNTFYVYVKTDTRFKGGNRITGLVPLSDAGAWETYVKQVFPNVEIKKLNGRKEASLGTDMYVGWNNNLLIIINVMEDKGMMDDEMDGRPGGRHKKSSVSKDDISTEIGNAFAVTRENSIIDNKRFNELESEGHDISFWLNYEQLMLQYSSEMADKMGVTLSNTFWKDIAFTAGFDFVKGKITGEVHYCLSDSLRKIGEELGSTVADKDMIERLPGNDMDMMLALHVSPKGIKEILEKFGWLGMANAGLRTQDMNVDNILDAFTGDMAIVMNDFSLKSEKTKIFYQGHLIEQVDHNPTLSMSYVVKINKKENFQALLKRAQDAGLKSLGNGFVVPIDEKDSIYIMMNDQYAVVSNKLGYSKGVLEGTFKSQKMSDQASSRIMGYPWALFIDVQQLFKNVDSKISNSAHDSVMVAESRNLLSSITFNGGFFKNNAINYNLDISFKNTDENSIIELMDFGMKMSDANNLQNGN